MKVRCRAAALILILAGSAMGGGGRLSAQLQLGSSMIGTGSAPSFWLGCFSVDGAELGLASLHYSYTAVVSRASFVRAGIGYRVFGRLAIVGSVEVGLPVCHMTKERTDFQRGSDEHSFRSVGSHTLRAERAVACTGYLYAPAAGVRWTVARWSVEPYLELVQGYLWRQVDVWWDPTGLPLCPGNYRIHHRDRIDRAFMRAALGISFAAIGGARCLVAAEWTSARNDPGGWYFLDWQDVHQRFDLSVGLSYAF